MGHSTVMCNQRSRQLDLRFLRRAVLVAAVVLSPLFTLAGCQSTKPVTTLGRPLPPLMVTQTPQRLPTPARHYTNPLYNQPQPKQSTRPTVERWTPPKRSKPTRMIGPKTIVVDAGHGGKDPGAIGRGPMVEKEIVSRIAKLLVEELELRGVDVIESRPNDRFISLSGRANIAERSRADLFVSVHADAAERAAASGTTVYIARNASRQSKHAGDAIEDSFVRSGFESRGVRTAGYHVLVRHSRPAVLVECGYVSNRAEAYKLSQPDYQQRIASAIAEGITGHFTR